MTLAQASKWMQAGSIIVIGFGVLIAAGSYPPLAGAAVFMADVMIWPFDGVQTGEATEFRFLSAIAGGVMVGWGVTLFMLSGRGMRDAPEMSRSIIWMSMLPWFVVDTTGSFIADAYLNMLGNTIFLAMFAVPLFLIKD